MPPTSRPFPLIPSHAVIVPKALTPARLGLRLHPMQRQMPGFPRQTLLLTPSTLQSRVALRMKGMIPMKTQCLL